MKSRRHFVSVSAAFAARLSEHCKRTGANQIRLIDAACAGPLTLPRQIRQPHHGNQAIAPNDWLRPDERARLKAEEHAARGRRAA
jgi:hypothetical protein